MKIGPYKLYSIETSEFRLDGGAMFGIIPKPLWEKQAPSDYMNRINMVTRSLLLVSDEKKILIDHDLENSKYIDKNTETSINEISILLSTPGIENIFTNINFPFYENKIYQKQFFAIHLVLI